MELDVVVPQKINAKFVEVHVKVCDSGCYTLSGPSGEKIAERSEDYVPSFFPEQHFGDYLILKIDIETGQIANWRKPSPSEVAEAFNLNGEKSE